MEHKSPVSQPEAIWAWDRLGLPGYRNGVLHFRGPRFPNYFSGPPIHPPYYANHSKASAAVLVADRVDTSSQPLTPLVQPCKRTKGEKLEIHFFAQGQRICAEANCRLFTFILTISFYWIAQHSQASQHWSLLLLNGPKKVDGSRPHYGAGRHEFLCHSTQRSLTSAD